jgi:hypothetical protein
MFMALHRGCPWPCERIDGVTKEKSMKRIARFLATGVAVSLLTAGLYACEKQEGPAERAGKAVDKTVESAGQQLEKAGQNIQDAAKDAKK